MIEPRFQIQSPPSPATWPGCVGHDGDVNPPERRTATWCDVYMSVPNLDGPITDRFQNALHAADRGLGVIVGTDHFILLTRERTEDGARKYAPDVVAKAARRAEISRDQLEGMTITKIVARERSLTGRPQRVTAPPDDYQTLSLGAHGRLHAMHEGPLGEWIVYLDRDAEHAWMGRDLLAVLSAVFELPHGRKEPWVYEVIEKLAGRRTPLGVRYACPCCDFLTLSEPPPGTFAICPVCWWEDNNVQFRDPDYEGGANGPSLRQARATFQRLGVAKPRHRERARSPLAEERP